MENFSYTKAKTRIEKVSEVKKTGSMQKAMQLNMALKLETFQNRLFIEKGLIMLIDL